ncbi:unnamed protein product, partial [Cuscuta epithymum]
MKRGCADDDNQDLYRHAGGGAALGDISPVAGDVFVHGGEGDDFDPMEIWLECVDHQDAEDLHLTPSPMDSNQSWPSSTEFPAASQPFNPFPDGNNNNNKNGINGTVAAGSDESPGLFGSEFPYQLFDGNGERLVRLGSSATKEARKKRMARQRKMSSHHFRHQNNSNTIRLGGGGGVEKCSV